MAEETTKVEPPTTVTVAPPAWDVNLQNVVKALMQSQKAGTAAGTPEAVNPYLLAAGNAAANNVLAGQLSDAGNLPAPAVRGGAVAAPAAKIDPSQILKGMPTQVDQLPVQDVLQMAQHQVNPQVEAATQRILKALMQQHAGGIVPQPPVAKG